jgi:hypothetical protein
MVALTLLFISVCCLIVGAAGVSLVISGPASILFAPLFAVFGWFYLLPIYALVSVLWLLHWHRNVLVVWRMLFVFIGAVVGGGLVALLGMLASHPDPNMYDGLILGGILAGGTGNFLITVLKGRMAEPAAPPNSRSPSQLPTSSEVQTPDTLRTPSSGGCG